MAIGGSADSALNDLYFYHGTTEVDAIVNIFGSLADLQSYQLLDTRLSATQAQELLNCADVIFLTGD